MSLMIITGPTGAGKSHYAIDTCRLALAVGKSVCFITPISTEPHFGHDTALAALFKLTESEPSLRLQAPISFDEIDLIGLQHIVLDEVHFNPVGAHRILGSVGPGRATVEFSTEALVALAQRCAGQACSLTCITQELPSEVRSVIEDHTVGRYLNIRHIDPHQYARQNTNRTQAA